MLVKGTFLTNDEFLGSDERLMSPNGAYSLVMQSDGNLCVYGPDGWMWGTQVTAPGGQFFAIMQSDGNFCVYRGTGPHDNRGGMWCSMEVISGGGACFAAMEDDGAFTIRRGTPQAPGGLLWCSKTASRTLIERYAPRIVLHPRDKHRPDSVENYFATVALRDAHGQQPAPRVGAPPPAPVTADVLRAYNDSDHHLERINGIYPTAAANFATGAVVTAGGEPGVGTFDAPVYVKSFRTRHHIDIKYTLFFPCQGFELIRIGVRSGPFATKKRTFEWSPFGRHGADWEHLTVRLDASGEHLLGAFYSRHHEAVWIDAHHLPLVEGTHPVAWSALNSHALYERSDTIEEKDVLNRAAAVAVGILQLLPGNGSAVPGMADIAWSKVVDSTIDVDDLVTYDPTPPPFAQVRADLWRHPERLVVVDRDPDADRWLDFEGCWGPPKLDNTHIDRPPALPDGVQDALYQFANGPLAQSRMKDDQRYGNGPRSPRRQGWWVDKEP